MVEPFRTDHNSFLESHNNRCFIGVPLPDTLKVKASVLQGLVSPIWHLGPHLLVSEAMPGQMAAPAIFAGGPSYLGTFQGERPVHSSVNAVVTSLLHRTHRMTGQKDMLAALLARGLQVRRSNSQPDSQTHATQSSYWHPPSERSVMATARFCC